MIRCRIFSVTGVFRFGLSYPEEKETLDCPGQARGVLYVACSPWPVARKNVIVCAARRNMTIRILMTVI